MESVSAEQDNVIKRDVNGKDQSSESVFTVIQKTKRLTLRSYS